MTSENQIYLVFAFFALVQLVVLWKRWNMPLVRGREWFLTARVAPDFYDGPGRRILNMYRVWMTAPYVLEALAVVAIVRSGSPARLMYLMVAMVMLTLANHVAAGIVTMKQVRPFALAGSSGSATARVSHGYVNFRLEGALALLNLAGLAFAAQGYSREEWPHAFLDFFAIPLLFLYLQLGILVARRSLENWRDEQSRRFYLDVCDRLRLLFSLDLVLWTLIDVGSGLFLPINLGLVLVWVMWYMRRRRAFRESAQEGEPLREESTGDAPVGSRFVCYRPADASLLVRGSHGYVVNLGSRKAQGALFYAAGIPVLLLLLRMR